MPPPADKPPSLARVQADFAARLGGRESGVPDGVVSNDPGPPLMRFNIYRNNAAAMLIDALRSRYSVVERLVGKAFFQATAHRFVTEHPPRSPALFEFGGAFADFLETFQPAQGLPYLPDVARLEWLRHMAYHAPDAEPMQAAALGEVRPDAMGDIVLRLHPSAGLLRSAFPVVSIWQTNSADEEVRRIGPGMKGEAALILRPRLEVQVMRLGPGGDTFLGEIGQGACLAVAAERAAADDPEFSLAGTLGALLATGAFTGYSLDRGGVRQGDVP